LIRPIGKQLLKQLHLVTLVLPSFTLFQIGSANPAVSQTIIMAGSESGGCTGNSRIVEKTDDSVFNNAINPFSLNLLESYISNFPDSKYTEIAKEIRSDEKRISEIMNGDTAELQCIPIESLGEGPIKSGIFRNAIKGRTTYEVGSSNYKVTSLIGGIIVFMENVYTITFLPPCGNGSVLIFKGGNGYIHDQYGLTGSRQNPLRMAYLDKLGLVYLGGQGTKYAADGSVELEFNPHSEIEGVGSGKLSQTELDFCLRVQNALQPGLNTVSADESGILINGIPVGQNGMCCGGLSAIDKDYALSYFGCEPYLPNGSITTEIADSSNLPQTISLYSKNEVETSGSSVTTWIIVLSSVLVGCLVIVGLGGGFEI